MQPRGRPACIVPTSSLMTFQLLTCPPCSKLSTEAMAVAWPLAVNDVELQAALRMSTAGFGCSSLVFCTELSNYTLVLFQSFALSLTISRISCWLRRGICTLRQEFTLRYNKKRGSAMLNSWYQPLMSPARLSEWNGTPGYRSGSMCPRLLLRKHTSRSTP